MKIATLKQTQDNLERWIEQICEEANAIENYNTDFGQHLFQLGVDLSRANQNFKCFIEQ